MSLSPIKKSNILRTNKGSFDFKTITLVLLVGAFWFMWDGYLRKKYPKVETAANASAPAAAVTGNAAQTNSVGQVSGAAKVESKRIEQGNLAPAVESLANFEDGQLSFQVSSFGMAIKNYTLKAYSDREQKPVAFFDQAGDGFFKTSIGGAGDLNFVLSRPSDEIIIGVANWGGMKITKQYEVDSKNFLVKSKISIDQIADVMPTLKNESFDSLGDVKAPSLFSPQAEHFESVVKTSGVLERQILDKGALFDTTYSVANLSSYGTQYFAVSILDRSDVRGTVKMKTVDAGAAGLNLVQTMVHEMGARSPQFSTKFDLLIGPKNYYALKSIDAELSDIVNFGFFTTIAKGLKWLMNYLQSWVSNWGVAIILLTIVVRILVLPFNLTSYRQMKVMAKIQPQLKSLKEKYKSQPEKFNSEMLALMKENKANPLGGCLPMLLQIPIFFALYQVIGQSIELYKSPFIFWIHDLSSKDPYFVLPALMAITMFFQQKLTPMTTMDPMQQKMMMYMPIVFSFLMVGLPSGLTLYIFISSVFGVAQQYFFTRESRAA
jgi:YidC/Oxa1 family membrane protein insertase